ncbi:hypothetical protein AOQ84DRAFT_436791, partial [Glonium stellatum]
MASQAVSGRRVQLTTIESITMKFVLPAIKDLRDPRFLTLKARLSRVPNSPTQRGTTYFYTASTNLLFLIFPLYYPTAPRSALTRALALNRVAHVTKIRNHQGSYIGHPLGQLRQPELYAIAKEFTLEGRTMCCRRLQEGCARLSPDETGSEKALYWSWSPHIRGPPYILYLLGTPNEVREVLHSVARYSISPLD